MKQLMIIVFLGACVSHSLSMTERKPGVTTNTLIGVWEAVSDRGVRVFQLEYTASGKGILVDAPYLYKGSIVYMMKQVSVKDDGSFFMEFEKDGRGLCIKGKGYASMDGGMLEVVLDKNPSGEPNIWKLKFVRLPEEKPYIQVIAELSKKAEKEREKAKAGKNQLQ